MTTFLTCCCCFWLLFFFATNVSGYLLAVTGDVWFDELLAGVNFTHAIQIHALIQLILNTFSSLVLCQLTSVQEAFTCLVFHKECKSQTPSLHPLRAFGFFIWLFEGKMRFQTYREEGGGSVFWGIAAKKIFHLQNVQDIMQLPLSHSLSLLSVGAKSHVSTASGCVDSFTNRNVKRRTQGGLRDKEELNRAGNRTNTAQGGWECHAKTPLLVYFNCVVCIAPSAPSPRVVEAYGSKCCCSTPSWFPAHSRCNINCLKGKFAQIKASLSTSIKLASSNSAFLLAEKRPGLILCYGTWDAAGVPNQCCPAKWSTRRGRRAVEVRLNMSCDVSEQACDHKVAD